MESQKLLGSNNEKNKENSSAEEDWSDGSTSYSSYSGSDR